MPEIKLNGTSLSEYGIISSVDYGAIDTETDYVDVPGSQTGPLDMSEADGHIKYRNRTIKIVLGALAQRADWKNTEAKFLAKFAGRRCKAESDDYPNKYAQGRVESIMPTYDHNIRYLTVSINAEPWWYNLAETTVSKTISGNTKLTLKNAKKPTIPKIIGPAGTKITLGDATVTLVGTGEEEYSEICLEEGQNTLQIVGTGTVKFAYREAQL